MNKPANFLRMMQDSSALFGANAPFIENLYESYLADAASVSPEWRSYFDALPAAAGGARDVAHGAIQRAFAAMPEAAAMPVSTAAVDQARKQVYVLQLINAYRFLGVRVASLDPLNRHAKPVVGELDPAYYGLTEADMDSTFNTGSLVTDSVPQGAGSARMTLREILGLLRQTYCGSIGAEYMYISDIMQKR